LTSVTVVAKDDALSEGAETITISLASTAFWDAGPATNANLSLLDDEVNPSVPTLQISVLRGVLTQKQISCIAAGPRY